MNYLIADSFRANLVIRDHEEIHEKGILLLF
jgi:hypothetical protein